MAPIELLNIDAIEVGLVPGNLVNFHVDCIWQGVVVAFDVDYLEQTFMSFISVLAKKRKASQSGAYFHKSLHRKRCSYRIRCLSTQSGAA